MRFWAMRVEAETAKLYEICYLLQSYTVAILIIRVLFVSTKEHHIGNCRSQRRAKMVIFASIACRHVRHADTIDQRVHDLSDNDWT